MKKTDIPVDSGVAGDIGDEPVAVYNQSGQLVVLLNICKHRGCQTEWNQDEKTWDCPCHGSRYAADGTVIHGPAQSSLDRLPYVVEGDEIRLTGG